MTIYDPTIHGEILVEFSEIPDTGCVYRLTEAAIMFRQRGADPAWRSYYEIMPWSIPVHVASIRRAPYQKIIADNFTGAVPDLVGIRDVAPTRAALSHGGETQTPRKDSAGGRGTAPKRERRKAVAKTKTAAKPAAKAKEAPVEKAQRLGARAKKLLEMELGLTRPQQEEVLKKADALSRARTLPNGRADGLTRIWDVYEAAGKKMPEKIAAEKADFMKTGVLKSSGGSNGNGSGKAPRGGKNADSPTPTKETSGGPSPSPETKHNNDGPRADATAGETPQPTPEPQHSTDSPEETETL